MLKRVTTASCAMALLLLCGCVTEYDKAKARMEKSEAAYTACVNANATDPNLCFSLGEAYDKDKAAFEK